MRRWHRIAFLAWICLLVAAPVFAGSIQLDSIVVRGGVDFGDLDDSFGEYASSLRFDLPWQWQTAGGGNIEILLETTLGMIRGGGEDALVAAVGPCIRFSKPDLGFFLCLGASPAYLSREKFQDEDFGGRFTFISYIGVGYHLTQKWSFGYRFEHMSNAGVYNKNPGLNMHLFEIAYSF